MSGASGLELLRKRRFLPFFLTQALGAFNDNVFKNALVIMIAYRFVELTSADVDFYSNLAAGLFILPFFLFSANAGQWAEKYEKSRSIRYIKLLEIIIMGLAAFAFWQNSLPLLILVLFLMGTQSTLFGPIKYSIMPQHLHPSELVGGNAWVEAGTFLAILLGTLLGGILMTGFDNGALWVSSAVIGIAIVGYLCSRHIPIAPATSPNLKFNWNPVSESWRNLQFVRSDRAVLHAVLGISWFWFFGATFIAQLPNYTKLFLGGNEQVAPLVLAAFSIGIGAGSLLCDKLSGRQIEIGLVPLGALGLTIFGIDIYFARPEPALILNLSAWQFFTAPGGMRLLGDLVMVGVSGGLYIVPLFAMVQSRTPADRVSRVIAANNILNALFMVVSAILAIALFKIGFSIPELFLMTAILNAVVAIYIFSLVPEFVMRFLSYMLVHTLYRLRVRGLENLPETGPAIVVCNHVSFMDALLIGGSIRRPVRFVMHYKIFRIPILSFMFRTAKTIPIASAKENPEMLERAMRAIDQALADGDIVGIFPEGEITRDGSVLTFKRGIEHILASRPVAVVPIALRGMWGSLFSRKDSALGKTRLPRRFRAPVELLIGEAVAAESASASASVLEEKVKALRGDWA